MPRDVTTHLPSAPHRRAQSQGAGALTLALFAAGCASSTTTGPRVMPSPRPAPVAEPRVPPHRGRRAGPGAHRDAAARGLRHRLGAGRGLARCGARQRSSPGGASPGGARAHLRDCQSASSRVRRLRSLLRHPLPALSSTWPFRRASPVAGGGGRHRDAGSRPHPRRTAHPGALSLGLRRAHQRRRRRLGRPHAALPHRRPRCARGRVRGRLPASRVAVRGGGR